MAASYSAGSPARRGVDAFEREPPSLPPRPTRRGDAPLNPGGMPPMLFIMSAIDVGAPAASPPSPPKRESPSSSAPPRKRRTELKDERGDSAAAPQAKMKSFLIIATRVLGTVLQGATCPGVRMVRDDNKQRGQLLPLPHASKTSGPASTARPSRRAERRRPKAATRKGGPWGGHAGARRPRLLRWRGGAAKTRPRAHRAGSRHTVEGGIACVNAFPRAPPGK